MATDAPTPTPIEPPPEYLRRGRTDELPAAAKASAVSLRKLLMIGLSGAVIAGFGTALWFAYEQGVRRGVQMVPVLVRAEKGPIKVKPDDPGGMNVPHRDKTVYDRLSGQPETAEAEKLLPPPENVVEKPLAAVRDAKAEPEPDDGGTPNPKVQVAEPPKPAPAAPQPKAQTASVSPDAIGKPKQLIPAAPKAASKPASEPKSASKPKSEPKKAPAAKPVAKKTAPINSYLIQIGAFRSADRARAGWQRLVKENKALLGSLTPVVVRADLGKKGVYHRLRAGPMDGKEAAAAMCSRLKQRKVGCLVIKPKP